MTETCKTVTFSINETETGYVFDSGIAEAIELAELELTGIQESLDSIKELKPNCDQLDYILAASSGFLCGIIDIFLVAKPGESKLGELSDKWVADKIINFANFTAKEKGENKFNDLPSALRALEKKYKVPYDQRGMGDTGKNIFNLNAKNHHFKSLGHNPTLMGLFFSILNQFTNTSDFVSVNHIQLQNADPNFKGLVGKTVPEKIFFGFVNWFGHMISDVSGSSGSKGRGMGIPPAFLAWTNDIIVIRDKIFPGSPVKFGNKANDIALKLYLEGFDQRFLVAQMIPVFINELIVRFIYTIRRMMKYLSETSSELFSFREMWSQCKPFDNPSVKRMLAIAHGAFCLVDIGDAAIRSLLKEGNPIGFEFLLRLNVPGIGRFAFSLFGEVQQEILYQKSNHVARLNEHNKGVTQQYIESLKELAILYDDQHLVNFVDDFKQSEMYLNTFMKSVELARLRNVPEENILKNKQEIDSYFRNED